MRLGIGVRVRVRWLGERNHNIPSEIIDTFDIFADFKFVNEIREEVNRINECMVMENACVSGTLKRDKKELNPKCYRSFFWLYIAGNVKTICTLLDEKVP